jgi:hypothetical protein
MQRHKAESTLCLAFTGYAFTRDCLTATMFYIVVKAKAVTCQGSFWKQGINCKTVLGKVDSVRSKVDKCLSPKNKEKNRILNSIINKNGFTRNK